LPSGRISRRLANPASNLTFVLIARPCALHRGTIVFLRINRFIARGGGAGSVDFPVSTACATAPAKGNANKPAARNIEREIEVMAVPFQLPLLLMRFPLPNGRASTRLWMPQCGTRRNHILWRRTRKGPPASLRAIGMAVALADRRNSRICCRFAASARRGIAAVGRTVQSSHERR
jgi:hypothetical protein